VPSGLKTFSALGIITILSLLALEGLSRIFLADYAPPARFTALVENWHYNYRNLHAYRSSRELGYEPIPGRAGYGDRGVLVNNYPLEKHPGITRILFVGDSVTRRRVFVDVLEAELKSGVGGGSYELWNAGVEGYNAVQYARLSRKLVPRIRPDLCIVGFHMNDFTSTPVAFREGEHLVVFTPGRSIYKTKLYHEWLFVHSTFYRSLMMIAEKILFSADKFHQEIYHDTLRALNEIRDLSGRYDADLLVLIFPYLKPLTEYSQREMDNYSGLLEYLRKKGVDFIDFSPALAQAGWENIRGKAGDGLTDGPQDPWHPNRYGHKIIGETIYKYLIRGKTDGL